MLDKKITNKVVRLGSRSVDPTVSEYSLDNLTLKLSRSKVSWAANREYYNLKEAEKSMSKLLQQIINREVPQDDLINHIRMHHPNHEDELLNPPIWISSLFADASSTSSAEGWETVGRTSPPTLLEYWVEGSDIKYLSVPDPQLATTRKTKGKGPAKSSNTNQFSLLTSDNEPDETPSEVDPLVTWRESRATFFDSLGVPWPEDVPLSDDLRPLEELLDDWNVWGMSRNERGVLHSWWTESIREQSYNKQTLEFERLKAHHEDAKARWQELRDEVGGLRDSWARTLTDPFSG